MDDLFTFVDEETVKRVRSELSKSPNAIDNVIADSLADVDIWSGRAKSHLVTGKTPSSPSEQLGILLLRTGIAPETESRGGHLAMMVSTRWAHEFISSILRELREIICSPKKNRKNLGDYAHGAVSALVTLLMQKFRLQNPTAAGIAVYILLTLGKTVKKAFCDSTDDEVRAALANN